MALALVLDAVYNATRGRDKEHPEFTRNTGGEVAWGAGESQAIILHRLAPRFRAAMQHADDEAITMVAKAVKDHPGIWEGKCEMAASTGGAFRDPLFIPEECAKIRKTRITVCRGIAEQVCREFWKEMKRTKGQRVIPPAKRSKYDPSGKGRVENYLAAGDEMPSWY